MSPWPFAGIGLLACTFFIFGGSLIFLHWWLVLVLYVLWVPMAMSGSRAFARNPRAVMPIALMSVGSYLVALGVQILTH